MKILLIEDEKKVANFIRSGLKSEGFAVDAASDGEEGLFLAQEGSFDLIILDILLPKVDGITVCKKLRAAGKSVPIIMLTAKDSVEDRVRGLDAGADDYLTKPFSFAELLARVRALTRRHKGAGQAKLKIGNLTLDPETFEVERGGKKITLSATEFRLLKFLMENSGRVVTKAMILENVWGYDFSPESNIVDVYIKYLRDKIDKGFKSSFIQTVRGIGYRLCASD
ncbi:MAG: response regulator transcription factor [Candidatus Margulisbacteria bacterium]|nr:response regulator transcription factor [Candidatus Margulisiibacteriota bacterium]